MNPVIYIMGVSGCGKSTIGVLLSKKTGIPFFDGDDFHSKENIEKMKKGVALSDKDRQKWIDDIHSKAVNESRSKGAIIACSALREIYRKNLSESLGDNVFWVFLKGDYETIYKRLENRKGHFMPPGLLKSQFDILENPKEAIEESITDSPEDIVADIIKKVNLFSK